MSKKRAIVTGGAGFVGSAIARRLLKDGAEVMIVDNLASGFARNIPSGVTFIPLDIRDHDEVNSTFHSFKPDVVFHQAAQMSVSRSVKAPSEDASINIVGLINCIKASKEAQAKKFIFASSGGCLYGEVGRPANEDSPQEPESPYGISKSAGEGYVKYFSSEAFQCISLRYSNVYGPGQNPNAEAGVIAIFSKKLFKNKQAVIFGTGGQVRDYVHVEDVARANMLASEKELGAFTAINVGTGQGTSVAQLAFLIQQAGEKLGYPNFDFIHEAERVGDLQRSVLCSNRAEKLLGWKPTITLDEGIVETVASYKESRA